jgi:hypothetical protein
MREPKFEHTENLKLELNAMSTLESVLANRHARPLPDLRDAHASIRLTAH